MYEIDSDKKGINNSMESVLGRKYSYRIEEVNKWIASSQSHENDVHIDFIGIQENKFNVEALQGEGMFKDIVKYLISHKMKVHYSTVLKERSKILEYANASVGANTEGEKWLKIFCFLTKNK